MGNAIKAMAKFVAKATVSAAGAAVPVIGGPIANWINSKYATGTADLSNQKGVINPGVSIPEDKEVKQINTPAALIKLIKEQPEAAKKAGLTVDMVKEEVAAAKEISKAIGGKIKVPMGMRLKPAKDEVVPAVQSKAVGGKVAAKKAAKAPTPAQLAARKKFTEMVRAKAKERQKKK
jgi:hypothetical protein